MSEYRHTFDGRRIHISDMTHQHLTNTYFFTVIFSKNIFNANIYFDEIIRRFDGKLLQYRPLASFPKEIDALYTLNMIIDGKIYFNDKCIGELPKGDDIIKNISELE